MRATEAEDQHPTIDVWWNNNRIRMLIDSGAQGNFISPATVNKLRIPWREKEQPYRLRTADGSTFGYEDGNVQRETDHLTVQVGNRVLGLVFDITGIADQEAILGMPWLKEQNPTIDWTTGQISWSAAASEMVPGRINTGKGLEDLGADACGMSRGPSGNAEGVTPTKQPKRDTSGPETSLEDNKRKQITRQGLLAPEAGKTPSNGRKVRFAPLPSTRRDDEKHKVQHPKDLIRNGANTPEKSTKGNGPGRRKRPRNRAGTTPWDKGKTRWPQSPDYIRKNDANDPQGTAGTPCQEGKDGTVNSHPTRDLSGFHMQGPRRDDSEHPGKETEQRGWLQGPKDTGSRLSRSDRPRTVIPKVDDTDGKPKQEKTRKSQATTTPRIGTIGAKLKEMNETLGAAGSCEAESGDGTVGGREPETQSPPGTRTTGGGTGRKSHEGQAKALRALEQKQGNNIPEEYMTKYRKLFQQEHETGLPKHQPWDHEIKLKDGTTPKFFPIYPLNQQQLQTLREYLEENLGNGYIRPSVSPAGYPFFFVPKKNGKERPVIDYRQLNDITIKNRYPLPLITELRDRLQGARWFTKLDLFGAYNLIRIKEGDEWKTAFRTRYGHYEYLVMPFGLTNAPATFQALINDVLREFLDDFVVVYLDDILIYSKTREENRRHVHKVLERLLAADLLVSVEKSEFQVQEVGFLGHNIRPGEVRMEQEKVQAVRDWPTPTNVRDVRAFLGFANYYRRMIAGFGRIATPLTNLTKKEEDWRWTPVEGEAFLQVKQKILEEPVLKIADPERQFEVETDASDYAIGAQLGQRDDNRCYIQWHSSAKSYTA